MPTGTARVVQCVWQHSTAQHSTAACCQRAYDDAAQLTTQPSARQQTVHCENVCYLDIVSTFHKIPFGNIFLQEAPYEKDVQQYSSDQNQEVLKGCQLRVLASVTLEAACITGHNSLTH